MLYCSVCNEIVTELSALYGRVCNEIVIELCVLYGSACNEIVTELCVCVYVCYMAACVMRLSLNCVSYMVLCAL